MARAPQLAFFQGAASKCLVLMYADSQCAGREGKGRDDLEVTTLGYYSFRHVVNYPEM